MFGLYMAYLQTRHGYYARASRYRRARSARTLGSPTFITLHGIVAFLCGGALGATALTIALAQILAWRRDERLRRFLPAALAATGAAFFAGLWLMLAAEYRWISGQLLDNASPIVLIAALWWIYRNRLRSPGNRRALEHP